MVDKNLEQQQMTEYELKLRAVITLQSAYRGYLARRRVQRRRERGEGQETAVIFFLQQVGNSSDFLYNAEKATRKSIRQGELDRESEDGSIDAKLTRDLRKYLQLLS